MWWIALAGSAFASDAQWSVGPHFGSWAIPAAYPSGFPKVLKTYDFDKTDGADDVDGDGTPDASTIEKTRGDFLFGVDGWFWLENIGRLGLVTNVDLGSRYSDVSALLMYDYMVGAGDQLDIFFGAGVGVGDQKWRGTDEDEKLRVPYYPLRAEAGAFLAPTDFLAPQLRIIGQFDVPSSHHYFDVAGNERTKQELGPGLYLRLGVDLTVQFGHFE
ncbi:MAG: hypothetical protein KC621_02835 [Myxococcales bacterium]|nr:hypothetical protein [Myxococcales bacterium]